MKQPKFMSFLESAVNIIVGLGVAMIANAIILPLVGFDVSLKQNVIIAAFMTVVSLIRSYGLRRLFEALHIRIPISPFASAVLAERQRQIDAEGWSLSHDDDKERGELAEAGACYAMHAIDPRPLDPHKEMCRFLDWPWREEDYKPTGFRRDLVKGCALIIAEGEKFDRARKQSRRPLLRTVTDDPRNNRDAAVIQESHSPSLQQGGKG